MSTPNVDGIGPGERLCPFCAEVIKRAGVKCRWCGSELTAEPTEPGEGVEHAGPIEPDRESAVEPAESWPGEADPAEVEAADAARPRLPRTGGSGWVTVLLAVLLVATGAGAWAAVKHAADSQVAPDGELASAAVRAGIMAQAGAMTETAMSYRAAEADADIAAAEKLMTPAMRKKYEADLPPQDQRAEQARMKVTIKASVASLSGKTACQSDDCAVSIVSATPDRARVLVFVDQNATAASTTHSVASPKRELLTLVKQDGTWLIDDMVQN